MATSIRIEVEREDLPGIAQELGIEEVTSPDDVTRWALKVLEDHITSRGNNFNRVDADSWGDKTSGDTF